MLISNGWTWAKNVRNARNTCEVWRKHNDVQRALNQVADRYSCDHVSMSYYINII